MKFEFGRNVNEDHAIALIWENTEGEQFLIWRNADYNDPYWIDPQDGQVHHAFRSWDQLLERAVKVFTKGDKLTITF